MCQNGGLVAVEMKERLGALGMNIIVRMIAGKRYLGTDEEETSRFQKALGKMKKTARELGFLLGNWVDEDRQRRLNRNINEEEQDFINVMLSAMDDGKISAQDANTVTNANCLVAIYHCGHTGMGTLSAIKQPPWFHIPAGARLFVNLCKLHRDPSIWLNPSEFIPERFLNDHANLDTRGLHFEYLPFSSGRRKRPGISFALQVQHLTLPRLLHAF
ncbi:hypothetical protein Ddye_006091 [Dipteronia dyeriana]|uniref:Cytochrome P450 n=1 Tax=Dipteronia dyeriana TaxID=168575 RepID=A0AAD9XIE2_9ROSI|nr:hypothetical protein Ddye_006091 [Dipteronia dyeriana]